jgi:hypothetical protein
MDDMDDQLRDDFLALTRQDDARAANTWPPRGWKNGHRLAR